MDVVEPDLSTRVDPDRGTRLRILFVTTECAPWVKTGGLGDVSAALPRALTRLGHDVRVLIPAYPGLSAFRDHSSAIELPARGAWPAAALHRVHAAGLDLWLLDCPALFQRPGGPYVNEVGQDHADNAIRFGFLSRVAADLCGPLSPCRDWPVDVLHANDWPSALAPAYLSLVRQPRASSVLTIHNLAFQGMFDANAATALELPSAWLNVDGVLHWDRISTLKAGIRHADLITTVSPTYAREIQTEALGFGMDGMLRLRSASLHGILNGIDTDVWDPRRDALLPSRYDAGDWKAKAVNKQALQNGLGLVVDPSRMVLGMVARLTEQKGVDLVADRLDWLVSQGAQLVVLGAGDAALEHRLRSAAASLAGRVAVRVGFDEALAHLIEAGADAFLMPSRFEPCGLNQMYSLAYGTPPIVCATGGLADTVLDADTHAHGTGFVMNEASPAALQDALERAMRAYPDLVRWRALQQRAMAQSFEWSTSAAKYAALYADLRART